MIRFHKALLGCILFGSACAHGTHSQAEDNSRNLFESKPSGHDHDIFFTDEDGNTLKVGRCGARKPELKEEEDQTISQIIAGYKEHGIKTFQNANIRTVMHVICSDDGSECSATQKMVDDQIDVFNRDFLPYKFSFDLVDTVYTNNSTWLYIEDDSPEEYEMKRTLAVDPATTFNVYVTSIGYLGWATFPEDYPEDDPLHGVLIHGNSLPGGTSKYYSLGRTLTHEAGHYLGLYHTFEDWGEHSSGCKGPGDYVDDTPKEASAHYGCEWGRDTCKEDGSDPIINFMDYSDDHCMNQFTHGQVLRMYASVEAYKPSLIMPFIPTMMPTDWPTYMPTTEMPTTAIPTFEPTSSQRPTQGAKGAKRAKRANIFESEVASDESEPVDDDEAN